VFGHERPIVRAGHEPEEGKSTIGCKARRSLRHLP
jgi:hypothetical protein